MSATATGRAAAAAAVIEECFDRGWSDGLPTIPCDEALLASFLDRVDLDPDAILLEMSHLDRRCSVRTAAINAAMAGCRPDYFPVVVAAWQAVAAEGWASAGMWQSTTGMAPVLVVHGPVREVIGLNSGAGIFGPGHRANATIGRALRLGAINVFGLQPGQLDQSTQATPAKYFSCFGENEADSPWSAYHEQVGHAPSRSAVTAVAVRSIVHVEARQAGAEQLLHDLAASIARTGALLQETVGTGLVLSPEHAHLLDREGFSRAEIRSFLLEHATVSEVLLARCGKDGFSRVQGLRIPGSHPDAITGSGAGTGTVRVLHPDDAVPVFVAGAWNCGVSSVLERFGTGAVGPATVEIEGATPTGAHPDDPEVGDVLAEVRTILERDGFGARWVREGSTVHVVVEAAAAECGDCLVPASVLRIMIEQALSGTRWRLGSLDMPAPKEQA